MVSDQTIQTKETVAGILGTCTVIGVIGTGQEADPGIAVTWLLLGIGLSLTYLLYRVVISLEQIADAQ